MYDLLGSCILGAQREKGAEQPKNASATVPPGTGQTVARECFTLNHSSATKFSLFSRLTIPNPAERRPRPLRDREGGQRTPSIDRGRDCWPLETAMLP